MAHVLTSLDVNINHSQNTEVKKESLLDPKVANLAKDFEFAFSNLQENSLKIEMLKSKGERITVGLELDKNRNEMKILNVYEQLLEIYPIDMHLSDQEMDYLDRVQRYPEFNGIEISNNYINLPMINFRIPSEMDNVVFEIDKNRDAYRLELELGIVDHGNQRLPVEEGITINEKLDREYKKLQTALKFKMPFKSQRDSLIFKEYKIHFMPKMECLFACATKIIKKISEDAELQSHLHTLKVTLDAHLSDEDPLFRNPLIVVYPLFGKEHAEKALSILFDYFSDDLEMGSHETPRFNVATKNGLITYAQGDGYKKCCIFEENPELFSKMFAPNGAHFNAKLGSSFSLNTPKEF